MTLLFERFGSVTLPTYEATHDLGTGQARMELVELPNGVPFDALGAEDALIMPPTYGLQCEADESTLAALQTTVDALRGLVGKRDKLYARMRGNAQVRWWYARIAEIGMQYTPAMGAGPYQPMRLAFQCVGVGWNTVHHGAGWDLDAGIDLDTGYVLDETGNFTLSTSPKTCTLANSGNQNVDNAIITVTAGAADITALNVAITTAGGVIWIPGLTEFDFTGTIAAGKSLVIDCGKRTVKNNGTGAYSGLAIDVTAHTVFPWLRVMPGGSDVIVTKTGGSTDSTITFDYFERWA
jgi:hypothetical protein